MFAVPRTRSSQPGFENFWPTDLRGSCKKYKFQANRYKNLSFVGMLIAALMPQLLDLEFASSSRQLPLIAWIVIGIWVLLRAIYRVLRRIPMEIAWLIREVKDPVAGLPQHLRNFGLEMFDRVISII
jgi:hypothetical protein